MNRRSFIKGVMATAAGGALALIAKDRVEAEAPRPLLVASGGLNADIHPLKNATASAVWDSVPHTFTATNGTAWALHQQTSVAPIEPQPFPPYDDWCGIYVEEYLQEQKTLAMANPRFHWGRNVPGALRDTQMQDALDIMHMTDDEFAQKYGPITFR